MGAKKDKTVTVTMSGPEVGKKGKLYKFFEQTVPIMGHVTGWLEIAEVSVTKVDKDVVTFTIDKEKNEIVMNGKKIPGFVKGEKVKFEAP